MYDERRDSFTIKDIILQLLFIVLLVFILIWLFPTKGYLETRLDGINNKMAEQLKPLYTRLFTENLGTMKDAAKSYYTTPRLPQKVGDKAKMTLGEMYEKGLLLELVDSNNKACDTTKSYIELTKMEDEYQLKAVLSCSDKEAFIIEYLGCYDYCNGKLCSKATETVTPVVTYRYQYVLQKGGTCTDFGAWSEWTKNKIEASDNVKVETKTEKVLDHYTKIWGVIGTQTVEEHYQEEVHFGYSTRTVKKENHYDYSTKTVTKVLPYETKVVTQETTLPYSQKTVKVTKTYNYTTKTTTRDVAYSQKTVDKDVVTPYSTRTEQVKTTYAYDTRVVVTGVEWVDAGTYGPTSTVPKSTDEIKYTLIPGSTTTQFVCNNSCETVVYGTYKVQKAKKVTTTEKYCSRGTDIGTGCQVTENKTVNYCAQGTDTGSGCLVKASQTVNYCPEGTDNGKGCTITETVKYCAQGTDTGSGCQVVTYEKRNYCAQGTDTGSGCLVKADTTVNYCTKGTDNGSGCVVTEKVKYCAKGTDTGKDCLEITYVQENYCAKGKDTGKDCVDTVDKTRPTTQIIEGWIDGEPVYVTVTYYRSKTRTCSGGTIDYKWSLSKDDQELKAQGYKLTGKVEVVK